MGFLSRTANRSPVARSLENPAVALNDPDAIDEFLGDDSGSSSGVKVTQKKALGWPPLLRGMSIITTDVAKVRLYVQKKIPAGGYERDLLHPSYSILRRKANPNVTAYVFKQTLTAHALWYGNGFAYIHRNAGGDVVPVRDGGGLFILDPQDTFPVFSNGRLEYVTTIKGFDKDGGPRQAIRRMPADDVLHIKGWSLDGVMGVPVWDLVRKQLGVPLAACEFVARFFAQGSNASGVLMIPGNIKSDAQENLIKAWSKMATGLARSHKVALLQDGAKFQPLTIDPAKSQLLELQGFESVMASLILGLPPHFLGDNSKAAYNSLESENQSYLDRSLDGWFCSWESEAEDKLLREREKDQETHGIEFNRQQLLSMSMKDRAEAYKKFREMGVFGANEILHREGEPGIGPAGDVRHIPMNWKELGVEPKQQTKATELVSAHTDLLLDRFNHFLQIESMAILSAGEKHSPTTEKFLNWSDSFYEKHSSRLADGLLPVVTASLIAFGRLDVEPGKVTTQVVTDYVVQTREALRACQDRRSVWSVVASLSKRGPQMITTIKGKA